MTIYKVQNMLGIFQLIMNIKAQYKESQNLIIKIQMMKIKNKRTRQVITYPKEMDKITNHKVKKNNRIKHKDLALSQV